MQELRLTEHKDNSLLFTTKMGQEYVLELNDENIQILREALKPKRKPTATFRPREIQSMLRGGKSAEEIAQKLNLDISDVQRYENPILAERAFILRSAHSVEVRTNGHEGEAPQQFGSVINERVQQLSDSEPEWSTWKTDTEWMVQASFTSDGIDRKAIWSFDHKKNLLNAFNADAATLSKQGDVGEKLIPTLRAVDPFQAVQNHDHAAKSNEEHSAVDNEQTDNEQTEDTLENNSVETNDTAQVLELAKETPAETDFLDEYTRRLNIEERAIQKDPSKPAVQSDTADLLEALRERRNKRKQETSDDDTVVIQSFETASDSRDIADNDDETLVPLIQAEEDLDTDLIHEAPKSKNKKNRPTVPSWEEILFGQKNDPSNND